jgi:serine phosphatase RsbU (regulator of sigma subunit)
MALGGGIKLKLTLAVVLSVVLTAAALTIITNILVSLTFELSLKERAQSTSAMITQALDASRRHLREEVDVLVKSDQFRDDITFKSWDHVNSSLEKLRGEAHNGGAVVVFLKNQVAQAGGESVPAQSLLKSSARAGAESGGKTQDDIETIDGKTLQVVATPIVLLDQTMGQLLAGSPIDASVLTALKDASGSDVLLVRGGHVSAGTMQLDDDNLLADLDGRLGAGMIQLDGLRAHGQPLLGGALPLTSNGKLQAALVFALSAKEATAIRKRVTVASIGLGILITVLCGLLGLFIATRISNPIVAIDRSFREIAASGDLSRRITEPYSDEVGRMAASFNQMQSQIEQLHARVVDAEHRMRDELKMASVVQEMLFPTTTVDGSRCTFASHSQTSTETGGDWFTIIDSPEQLTTTVVIADVTGHGVGAALVTAILHGFFKAMRATIAQARGETWRPTIESILHTLNQTVIESTRHSLTTSLSLYTFDHRTLRASYVNAGHLAAVLVAPVGGRAQVTTASCPPSSMIGDIDRPNLAWGELQFQPGQLWLLYTDGLVECTNAAQEMYGYKRMRKCLLQTGISDARAVRDQVLGDALAFFGDMPPADDITLIVGSVR